MSQLTGPKTSEASQDLSDELPQPPCWHPYVGVVEQFAAARGLSVRETQVLARAALGRCMKETAAELDLSIKTVENYWSRIYHKTGHSSQLAVVAEMLRGLAARTGASR